ncbi:MAG: hypothetical protein M3418_01575, partial [Gemmatimonadota bacterium]|nr:hypothetical protein [Gemmatimonadota bacterium]
MDAPAVERALARMAREIVEQVAGTRDLVLVGIHRRGVELAQQLATEIESAEGAAIPTGSLDITLYRDDLMAIGPRPWSARRASRMAGSTAASSSSWTTCSS